MDTHAVFITKWRNFLENKINLLLKAFTIGKKGNVCMFVFLWGGIE